MQYQEEELKTSDFGLILLIAAVIWFWFVLGF